MKNLYSNGKIALNFAVTTWSLVLGLVILTTYSLSHWRWEYNGNLPESPAWITTLYDIAFYLIPLLFLVGFVMGLLSVRNKTVTASSGQTAIFLCALPVFAIFVHLIFILLDVILLLFSFAIPPG